jgi:two-component system, cell cycle sensor histidine kinase and response regulator CckA
VQFRELERMAVMGRLAAGVAHDFNNLLCVIRGAAEFMVARLPTGDLLREQATEILDTAERGTRLTAQILGFGRQTQAEPAALDLNAALFDMQGILHRLLGERVALRLELGANVGAVQIDRSQLEQVVANLVVNGRDAMPQGGTLVVRTMVCHPSGTGESTASVALVVQDTGTGMTAETKHRLFEPFFTTKGREGSGLGLATVHGIVRQAGGSIRVWSEPGCGATFELRLPSVGPRHGACFMPSGAEL